MSQTAEINPKQNEYARLISRLVAESKALAIAGIALVAACLAAVLAVLAYNDAKEAYVRVEVELQATRAEMAKVKEEVETLEVMVITRTSE